ncbi:hypothetical protein [Mycobacterium deserti]|uniref:Uncharacterized protein n=1 Tax=Mycobacterium deserti TaxID=2978347 RepID=A0ABT2M3Z6_9MYCO|nr:hypothetical protein [Mycobacterium deserti]MCT7656983.1 hypothetical protein [Mycobacterium deserti]
MTSAYALAYGMIAMTPVLFASAGYVLVSSEGDNERRGCRPDE